MQKVEINLVIVNSVDSCLSPTRLHLHFPPLYKHLRAPEVTCLTMSVDENVFRSLVDMGIDSVLARAAAARFTHSEAAVNWCFGDGANVS
jgi:uncharacterized UBP type Zn finger protein